MRNLMKIFGALFFVASVASAENPWPYAEDAVHASGDRGWPMLGVRKDSATSLCSADGKWCVPIFDANGKLWVNAVSDSELPAAAALADNTANPTVPSVGSMLMCFDGATWDRCPGTSADGLQVNLGTNNDVDTELPSAAALGDDTANPTVTSLGSFGHLWDGATWDRTPGSAEDGALVNLGTNNDVTVTSTTLTATVLPAGAGAMVSGTENIEATGTAEQLGSNACKIVILSCPAGNTSDCYFRADAGNGVTGGIVVPKSTSYTLPVSNTNLVWVDAGTNDDDVNWVAVN
jgi:hypothetical protein